MTTENEFTLNDIEGIDTIVFGNLVGEPTMLVVSASTTDDMIFYPSQARKLSLFLMNWLAQMGHKHIGDKEPQ
jgi:hypothetical protein